MSRNLKMPWSIEDTIENMEHIRDIMIKKVRSINLDGKAENDVREVNFDFFRVKKALEKQVSKKPIEKHYEDNGEKPYIKICCPNGCHVQVSKFDNYCNKCGQKLDWDIDS